MAEETKIRKILQNEIAVTVSIIVAVLSVFGVYKQISDEQLKMQADITYIKENHLAHIEKDISDIRLNMQNQDQNRIDDEKNIVKILTILEQHEAETKKTATNNGN